MADYPGNLIFSSILISANVLISSQLVELGIITPGNSIFNGIAITNLVSIYGNGNSNAILSLSDLIASLDPPQTRYFNDGFVQDVDNVYLSKQPLGISSSLDTSLESLFIALLKQWASTLKPSDESPIECELFAYDKLDNYIIFSAELRFKKGLTITDDEILNLPTSITPLDI